MILSTYGPNGWGEKIFVLQKRTDLVCKKLTELKVEYFRHPNSNIITMKSNWDDNVVNPTVFTTYIVPMNLSEFINDIGIALSNLASVET
jgi:hypothetical protein